MKLTLSEVLDGFSQIHGQWWIKEGYFAVLIGLLTGSYSASRALVGGELRVKYEDSDHTHRLLTFSRGERIRFRLVLTMKSGSQEPEVDLIQTTPDLFHDAERAFKTLRDTRMEAEDLRRPYGHPHHAVTSEFRS